MYKIEAQDNKTNARCGVLKTAHGRVKTPFLMPVATKGNVKFLSTVELKEMGVNAIISNAFLLNLKPGSEFLKKAGGLHKFINFDRTIFTDSGGFQMISKELFLDINDKGVQFRDPYNYQKRFFTPEDVMKIEIEIGSDVAMALDHMPHVNQTKDYVRNAVRRTHLWAQRCIDSHEKLKNETGSKQLLFGIAQGGKFKDIREKSAKFIDSLDFDGVAMGGLCIGETRAAMFSAIENQIKHISKNKTRYLMGLGTPQDILEAVERGCDSFDSIFPTQNARHGNLFTENGFLKVDKGKFRADFSPIDENCNCITCKNYSRAYLYHLFKTGDKTVYPYLTYHNIYWTQNFMKEVRTSIKENEFARFKKDFLKKYKINNKVVTTERLAQRLN